MKNIQIFEKFNKKSVIQTKKVVKKYIIVATTSSDLAANFGIKELRRTSY